MSEAPPGQPFATPQTLVSEDAAQFSVPEDELEVAGDGKGGHVVQWEIGAEHTIESARQVGPTQPFGGASVLPFLQEKAALSGTLMDETDETMSLLLVPSGVFETGIGALAVVRGPAGVIAPGIEYLVSPQAHESVEDAHLAVRPDGFAAVVWVAKLVHPNGGTTSRVMLATAPPSGPFGPPAAVTGPASLASGSAVAFDSTGVLHIAWTAEEQRQSGRVFAVSTKSGSADPLSTPGPRVTLRARQGQDPKHGLVVTVSVDRPCLVRLQALAPPTGVERKWSLGLRSREARHYFATAATATLHIRETPANSIRGKRPSVRVLAYASAASEASTVASLRAFVRPGGR